MKLHKTLLSTAAAVSIGFASIAQSAETLPDQELGRIIHYGDKVVVQVTGLQNTDSCTRANNAFIGFDSEDAQGRQFLAMVLTAKASGATVSIRTNGCVSFASATIPELFQFTYR